MFSSNLLVWPYYYADPVLYIYSLLQIPYYARLYNNIMQFVRCLTGVGHARGAHDDDHARRRGAGGEEEAGEGEAAGPRGG